MKKAEFDFLGLLFEAEVTGRLFQRRDSKLLLALESDGMIERIEATLPGKIPVICKGWILTQRGMLLYCQECEKRLTANA